MQPIRLISGFLTVGLWTLASRLLGFVRDILIAAYLGAGPAAEAFMVAFALPNMFRRFFAEGAFNMAFVPMFSKRYEAGEDAAGFAREAMSGLAAILIALTVLAQFIMPWLVFAMASGFLGDERFDLAVGYGRIVFPYILFISLAALLSGVLNATGRFAAAAAAPLLLNVILSAALYGAGRAGVGRQVASFYEAAVAWLGYADRLYQLPLGVVAIAIGVVLLPDLSRRLSAEDTEGGRDAFNRAGEFALMLTVPAAVALVAIPVPLVSVLFERGAFGADDTAATALALAVYGLGLPAFVLQKVLQPLYFAREDTRRPFRYAVVAMIVNAAVAIGLSPFIGFIAAALATTLAGWAMVWLLWSGSRRLGEAARLDRRSRARVPRIVISALVMGAVLWTANLALAPMFVAGGAEILALVLLIGIGMVSYFGLGQLIGAFRLAEIARAFRRRQG